MVKKIRNLKLKSNMKIVLNLIECNEESVVYNEMVKEYNKLWPKAEKLIEPVILINYGQIPEEISNKSIEEGKEAIFCIISIGNELSKMSTSEFENGDYVAGMILNSIADEILFQLDEIAKTHIIAECKKRGLGIEKRLEAPNNIEMRSQKVVWEKTNAYYNANITINDSYVFNPVKTYGQIYLLNNSCRYTNLDHNCDECGAISCKFRKNKDIKLTILNNDSTKDQINIKKNETIKDALIRNNKYIPAICNGKGTCGKCSISIIEGNIDITNEDRTAFTEDQLNNGKRLSCRAYIKSDCTIKIDNNEENFDILVNNIESNNSDTNKIKTAIAIDIGTTTIAMQLINITTMEPLDTYTTINHQRVYGADIISRISVSNNGKLDELQLTILKDLENGLKYLKNKLDKPIESIVITGNTTMIHLLLGYPCNTLGVYPFRPYSISSITSTYNKIFKKLENKRQENIKIEILPGISTFIGADIVSGLLSCNFDSNTDINLFVDLGTNGEMAIGNKNKILVTSTAAGPAFEGGNIKNGIGSIQGAISAVTIDKENKCSVQTIGNKKPVGICGTGVVEIVYELLKKDLIDETGLLDDMYFEKGFPIAKLENNEMIYFTAKDVREIQLAKSAIRSGLEILIKKYEVTCKNIKHVFVAGGFGYKLNIEKAIGIGMFPEELESKIITIGNSSLQGGIIFASRDSKDRVKKICDISSEVNLNSDSNFNDLYMKYIYFE